MCSEQSTRIEQLPAHQPATALKSALLQRFLSERTPLMLSCALFIALRLGLHRMCVGRMKGRGRKEKLHIIFVVSPTREARFPLFA